MTFFQVAAWKVAMFIFCVHIYVLSIELPCGIFDGNNADLKKFETFYKSEEYQTFWYHRDSVIVHYAKLVSPNQGVYI